MILAENKLLFKEGSYTTVDKIPVGNWQVKFNPDEGSFYLQKMKDFTLPSKIYGDSNKLAKRYLNTFNKKNKNLGVALTGLKGTGKSLLAKTICIESNLPILCIDAPFFGPEFNSFISGINQEVGIYVDEFEKVYNEEEPKNSMLTLLEGIYTGKKLFVFTSNEVSRYSNFLLNRPGRIHYMKNFERIEDNVLNEIIDENLINKENKKGIVDVINQIEEANIDMVFALVQEMNEYNETAKESVPYLNIDLSEDMSLWSYTFEYKGSLYSTRASNPFELDGNSLYFNQDHSEVQRNRKLIKKAKEEGDKDLIEKIINNEYELCLNIDLESMKVNQIDRNNMEISSKVGEDSILVDIKIKKESKRNRSIIF